MVYVPAGQFTMGRDWLIGERRNEEPVHTVYVDAFYIDKYETTRGAFRQFVEDMRYKTTAEKQGNGTVIHPNGAKELSGISWRDSGFVQEDSHPVVLVSWYDAKAYANWCGKSLPTEAQWEKAASWDESAPDDKKKRSHPWGNNAAAGPESGHKDLPKLGNFGDVRFGALIPEGTPFRNIFLDPYFGGQYDDGYVYTAPVGQFFPLGGSPYGAFDMNGNVREWCEDGFAEDFYSRSPKTNPVNSDGSKGRVVRGFGYETPCTAPSSSTVRLALPAERCISTIGFRCIVWGPKK